jgi:diguanylate cyclase (GGDEF)-like protein
VLLQAGELVMEIMDIISCCINIMEKSRTIFSRLSGFNITGLPELFDSASEDMLKFKEHFEKMLSDVIAGNIFYMEENIDDAHARLMSAYNELSKIGIEVAEKKNPDLKEALNMAVLVEYCTALSAIRYLLPRQEKSEDYSSIPNPERHLEHFTEGVRKFARDSSDWKVLLKLSESALFLVRKFYELERKFEIDYLTTTLNRTSFLKKSSELLSRAVRYSHPFSFFLLDLDDLRNVNAKWGLSVGDEVLKMSGVALKTMIRETDTVGRIGGEEFGIAVLSDPWEGILSMAKKIRDRFSNESILLYPEVTLTVSMGIVYIENPEKKNLRFDDILYMAEQSMTKAKLSGKNCFELQKV